MNFDIDNDDDQLIILHENLGFGNINLNLYNGRKLVLHVEYGYSIS